MSVSTEFNAAAVLPYSEPLEAPLGTGEPVRSTQVKSHSTKPYDRSDRQIYTVSVLEAGLCMEIQQQLAKANAEIEKLKRENERLTTRLGNAENALEAYGSIIREHDAKMATQMSALLSVTQERNKWKEIVGQQRVLLQNTLQTNAILDHHLQQQQVAQVAIAVAQNYPLPQTSTAYPTMASISSMINQSSAFRQYHQ